MEWRKPTAAQRERGIVAVLVHVIQDWPRLEQPCPYSARSMERRVQRWRRYAQAHGTQAAHEAIPMPPFIEIL